MKVDFKIKNQLSHEATHYHFIPIFTLLMWPFH